MIASQAKELYKEFWDEYFTFSFVRNPWDRVVSCLKFSSYFGIYYKRHRLMPFLPPRLRFEEYQARFGAEIVLEHDYRFYKREELISKNHFPRQVYRNILDEKLDFIGTFETLAEDCQKIRHILGIKEEMQVHEQRSVGRKQYQDYYNQYTRKIIHDIYAKDIEQFNYKF